MNFYSTWKKETIHKKQKLTIKRIRLMSKECMKVKNPHLDIHANHNT